MILLLAAAVGVFAFMMLWRAFGTQNRSHKLKRVAVAAAVVLLGVLLLLTASGRLHWLAALAAGALPFLRGLIGLIAGPLVGNFVRSKLFAGPAAHGNATPGVDPGSAPKDSTVATAELRMTLDHETGAMDGEILVGRLAGQRLSSIELDALATLLDELATVDSRQLLTAYLDRRFPGWSDSSPNSGNRGKPPPGADGGMDSAQALAVLGLDEGASKDEIVDAHRRLMQKLHPDRGGTDYLAATLNLAKKVLLNGR